MTYLIHLLIDSISMIGIQITPFTNVHALTAAMTGKWLGSNNLTFVFYHNVLWVVVAPQEEGGWVTGIINLLYHVCTIEGLYIETLLVIIEINILFPNFFQSSMSITLLKLAKMFYQTLKNN